MSLFKRDKRKMHTYLVTLRGHESRQSKVYQEEAPDGPTAVLQARLRHLGSDDPWDVDHNRSTARLV